MKKSKLNYKEIEHFKIVDETFYFIYDSKYMHIYKFTCKSFMSENVVRKSYINIKNFYFGEK